MTRIWRDGLAYVNWVGDHPPRHVHVYQDGRLILKWNLDEGYAIQGEPTRRIVKTIRELRLEGKL
jgi:hypothetical protein